MKRRNIDKVEDYTIEVVGAVARLKAIVGLILNGRFYMTGDRWVWEDDPKMREIKFRAWHRKEKKMIAGALVFWLKESAETGKNPYPHCDWMQYTGIDDKNGVEIYEGDIVKTPIGNRDVKWLSVGWSLLIRDEEVEVIGNKFENPELLGGDKAD